MPQTSQDKADAETLLSSVIADPKLYGLVSYIKPVDLDDYKHQAIWAAITATLQSGGAISPQSLNAVDPNIDPAEIIRLGRASPRNPEACRKAARRISDLHRALQAADILAKAAGDIRQAHARETAGEDNQNWLTIFGQATRAASKLTASAHVTPASVIESRVISLVTDTKTNAGKPIPTGIRALDKYLSGGLRGGNLIAIGAQTKVGKTVLAASISHNLEVNGVPHEFITLERRQEDIERLKLARRLGVKGFEFLSLPPFAFENLAPLDRTCLYYHIPGLSIEEICAELRYQAFANGCRVGIIDYYQLIGGRGPKESPDAHMTRVAQMLQQTGVDTNMALIVTVQLNEYGVPIISSAIRNAANLYLVVQRDRGASDAYLETHASNIGPEHDIGSIGNYSLVLDPIGPAFRDPIKEQGTLTPAQHKPTAYPAENSSRYVPQRQ